LELGPFGLTLRNLNPGFDSGKEPRSFMKVWTIFPGLPLVFWTSHALEAIDNKLGVFSILEPNWEWKEDKRWAWLQVEVDMHDGLVRNVDLVFDNKIWHQKVDY